METQNFKLEFGRWDSHNLHPCYSCKMFHEPQCWNLTVLVWLWRPPTYTCTSGRLILTQKQRGPLTESLPLTPVLSSVFLGNLLPQFGFDPTHLEGESSFTGRVGDSKPIVSISKWSDAASRSYFLWRLGWGQLSWQHWTRVNKIRLSEKSEMVPKDIGVMKCSGQGWGAFWGDWEEKEDEVTMCEIQMNQQWFEKARQIGTCPVPFQRAGTKPKKVSENLTPIFILTFNRIFIAIFILGSLSTFPSSCQRGRDSECIHQRPADPCVQLFWS